MAILTWTGGKKSVDLKVSRFLITVTVVGSAGPIRVVVKEGEMVSDVIVMVLRSYQREGRRPVLGFDLNTFLLYCSNSRSEVLGQSERLHSNGGRNFVLCRKQQLEPQKFSKGGGGGVLNPLHENSVAHSASVLCRKQQLEPQKFSKVVGGGVLNPLHENSVAHSAVSGKGVWKSLFNSFRISSH